MEIRELIEISIKGSNINELMWMFSEDINTTRFIVLIFSVSFV